MVIPAIDFMGGRVVQLVEGERLALERDLDQMLETFAGFPVLQVIDLDAAKGEGSNRALVERCCRAGFCVRVGGGLRSVAAAQAAIAAGAEKVIIGTAAWNDAGPAFDFLEELQAVGRDRITIALDSKAGHVAVAGWRKPLPVTPFEAVAALDPYTSGYLYTHVDTEGTMQGAPISQATALRARTTRELTIAGGIATIEEIATLTALGCHAVLGMAIYTGRLDLKSLIRFAT
ncbi:MAG TPA: HisA/HisF-related TIM barrel protein [Terriglobales bacterium]|nr:HisA/HisF-related TIM barrel protein [Terriglobales bacterium]